jgi:hypothetical protein
MLESQNYKLLFDTNKPKYIIFEIILICKFVYKFIILIDKNYN